MKPIKTGAMIAMAVGGLFATACKKEEKKTEPAKVETAGSGSAANTAADKPAETKPAEGSAAVAPQDPAAGSGEKVAKIDCAGVNECKGKGTCKTATHGCSGQNECKGKGVVAMSEEECKTKGGTVSEFSKK